MFALTVILAISIVVLTSTYVYKSYVRKARSVENLKNAPETDICNEEETNIYFLFGSQTGTAEGFCKDLSESLSSDGITSRVIDIEDADKAFFYKVKQSENSLVAFFVATYGEGDPTDNALEFHSWLKSSEHTEVFDQLKVAVFGLGNTQYEFYNGMGRFLRDKLTEYKAQFVCPYGEGDEDNDIEDDFEKWSNIFKSSVYPLYLQRTFSESDSKAKNKDNAMNKVSNSKFEHNFVDNLESFHLPQRYVENYGKFNISRYEGETKKHDLSTRHFFNSLLFKITTKRELRADTGSDGHGSTLHIELKPLEDFSYNTADNFAICPENPTSLVEEFTTLIGLNKYLDKWLEFSPKTSNDQFDLFPTPLTLRTILTCYISLNQTPSRGFLKKLAEFANISEHRERLLHLSSKDGRDEYKRVILDRDRDIVEVIEMFPSINAHLVLPNLTRFVEILPKMAPRYYTTSSSSLQNPDTVHVTVSRVTVAKRGIPKNRLFRGACTHFLANLKEGDLLHGFVRPSTFKLPRDPTLPIILIGPGTGIAPMRAFLQEREHLKLKYKLGQCLLFFGCRRQNEDFIYQDELLKYVSDGVLTRLIVAFSRQTEKKVYVQNKLEEEKTNLANLIVDHKAVIYVCGGTQMGKDVHKTLTNILSEEKFNNNMELASEFIANMSENKAYIQELWSV